MCGELGNALNINVCYYVIEITKTFVSTPIDYNRIVVFL